MFSLKSLRSYQILAGAGLAWFGLESWFHDRLGWGCSAAGGFSWTGGGR